MAYRSNFDKFRRQLYAVVNERANRVANEVSAEVVKVFVNNAKARLDKASSDFTPESSIMISSIKDNIYYETEPYFFKNKTSGRYESVNRSFVRVRNDPQNLLMFLEYGTGLVGESQPHPEANSISWDYAINKPKYRKLPTRENDTFGGLGWFFTRKPNSIMSKNDEPIHRYAVDEIVVYEQTITTKKGLVYKRRQPYHKKRKGSFSGFSQGIKPIRFIYDTKQEIKNLFKASRGALTVDEFYKNLNKLKNK